MSTTSYNKTKYAPGIVTYGADGEIGQPGKNGYSVYYLPFNINDEQNQKYLLNTFIKKNKYVSNIPGKSVDMIDRAYQPMDLFISPDGMIYMLSGDENGNVNNIISVGNLNIDIFSTFNNEYVILKDSKNLVIGDISINMDDNTENDININHKLTIIGDNAISLYGNDYIKNVSMRFDNNGNFNIDSNVPIVINNLDVIYDDSYSGNKLLYEKDGLNDISCSQDDSNFKASGAPENSLWLLFEKTLDGGIILNYTCSGSSISYNGEPYMVILQAENSCVSKLVYLKNDNEA